MREKEDRKKRASNLEAKRGRAMYRGSQLFSKQRWGKAIQEAAGGTYPLPSQLLLAGLHVPSLEVPGSASQGDWPGSRPLMTPAQQLYRTILQASQALISSQAF